MAGLDKIISQIAADAKAYETQVLEEAEKTAQECLEKGREQAAGLCQEITAKSREEIKNYHDRINSAADFQKRTALLKAKQEMIAQTIEKAYETLAGQETAAYFEVIHKMLRRFVLKRAGEIYFSQADLKRMPEDFEALIEQTAADRGGTLSLMQEPKAIANGFVLVYGGIEENCTFRAVFDACKEMLQDQANEWLFRPEKR